jgi:hypothetical protein
MVMKEIFTLPLEIHCLVREYFVTVTIEESDFNESLREWRNFCNCSKKFAEIKYHLVFYDLSPKYTAAYVRYDDVDDMATLPDEIRGCRPVIHRLVGLVSNVKHQVFLTLDFDLYDFSVLPPYPGYITPYTARCYGLVDYSPLCLTDYSIFRNVVFLHLRVGENDIDVFSLFHTENRFKYLDLEINSALYEDSDLFSLFRNCEEIDLSFSDLDRVSFLSGCNKLRKLSLNYCEDLSDVSSLSNCKGLSYLDLGSTSVTDVSMFGKLKTLLLSDCRGITDISALGGVSTLDIKYSHDISKGIPSNNNLRVLYCDADMINELQSFTNKADMKHLYILLRGDCQDFDLSRVNKYRKITFVWSSKLRTICGLLYLQDLSLQSCFQITTIKNLPFLSSLTIEDILLTFKIDFLSLPLLTTLSFKSIENVEMIKFNVLPSLKNMRLKKCKNIHIVLFTDLLSLKIERCQLIQLSSCTLKRNDDSFKIDYVYIDYHSDNIKSELSSSHCDSNIALVS